MKFDALLSRADTVMADLMPTGTLSAVSAIDPNLAYPRNLVKVLLRLRPPSVLLEDAFSRGKLLMMLPLAAAKDLALLLSWDQKGDSYTFLSKTKFKKLRERKILFDFFELEIPEEETKVLAPVITEVKTVFPLFPHQAKALRRVENFLAQEPRRALLHMPTGSGKTRTAMNVVANYMRSRDHGVVVWLAHSEELCEQAMDEFQKAWSALGIRDVQLIRFWGPYDIDLRDVTDGVIIAGLKKAHSSLLNNDSQLRALSTRDPLVVMDEAHQAIAPTYKLIIDQLLRPMSNAQFLGLSATPGRSWNDPEADRKLASFFANQKVTLKVDGYDNPVSYLISQGYLAKPKFLPIEVASSVALSAEEQDQLSDTFEIPTTVLDKLGDDEQRNLLIVHHAEQLLKRHKRVILFASSVRQSDLLSAVLSARGYWAASITSKSPNGRAESIAAFKDDDDMPKILCNFGVLTTGFDAPRTSAALIARPTFSLVLYSQMVGRAMRGKVAGGNETCEILTVVDTTLPGFDSVVEAFSNWEDVWSE